MAKKPSLTDVKTLRKRAREHMEQGAVTPGHRAKRDVVIELLDDALATELVCVLRYRRHHFMASGINAQSIAQLGGAPGFLPEGMARTWSPNAARSTATAR